MKKVFYFSVLALTVSALTLSCNKTAVEEPAQEEIVTPVTRTFTCTFAEPDTKVAIDDDGKTTWEVGDKIMIHAGANGSGRELITLTEANLSPDHKSATITTSLAGYDRTDAKVKSQYYAQYPGDLVPAGNMYYECCFNGTNDKLMAACDVDGAFVFYNLCGIISFTVSGDFDQVVFAGNDNETVGYSDYYQVRIRYMTSGSMETNFNKPGNGFTTSTPAKSIVADITADGTTVNNICIPNPSDFNGGFTMSFLKSGAIVKTLSTTKKVTLARGKYRPMGDVTAYLKDYVAPTSHDNTIVADITSVTDLSASETANCYIVDGSVAANAGKVFKFKAAKGKGGAVLTNIGGDEDKDVVVLWETKNTSTAPNAGDIIAAVDYDMQAGEDAYIVFKMPDSITPGNALIAAKDAAGNILWSWHIWVPKTTIGEVTDATIFGSKAIMTRNLGALVDAPADAAATVQSYGLLYEWGRKDPFPGMADLTTNSPAAVSGTAMTKVNNTMTIEETVKNPTQYAWRSGDWCDAGDQSKTLWTTSKTIYDPCPPGYIVPARNTSVHYWGSTTLNTLVATDNFVDNGATYYSYSIGTSTPIVFPYAGYIDNDSGSYYKAGARSIVWSSYCSTLGQAYARDSRHDETSFKRGEPKTSRAASVRCVAE